MVGVPVHADAQLSFCERKHCKYSWKISTTIITAEKMRSKPTYKKDEWQEVSNTLEYTPTEEDIGRVLRFECQPIRDLLHGEIVESQIEEIKAGTGPYPFEKRHDLTKEQCDKNSFRVMSYNMLADTYVDSEHSREVLFAYCPVEFLNFEYRKQLLIKEILGYNGDIICLQEVDSFFFKQTLSHVLDRYEFDGHFNAKPERDEGTAIFVNRSKFRLLAKHDIDMMQWFQEDESCTALLEKVKSNEAFKELALSRKTEVQVCSEWNKNDGARKIAVGKPYFLIFRKASKVFGEPITMLLTILLDFFIDLKRNSIKSSSPFHFRYAL